MPTINKTFNVVKLGGHSLKDSKIYSTIQHIVKISKTCHFCVVVSARHEVTDNLKEMAFDITPKPDARELDTLLSVGEIESSALFAIRLNKNSVKARSINTYQLGLRTDSSYGKARVINIKKNSRRSLLSTEYISIIPGFQGLSPNKSISTLGRGGSDTTAVCLASATDAENCVIYKRYPGIYDTDPYYDVNSSHLASLPYDELLEMSSFGMNAINQRAVQFAYINKVPVYITSIDNPDCGTHVSNDSYNDQFYKFVIGSSHVLVSIKKVKNEPGSIATIFAKLLEKSVYISAISQNIYLNYDVNIDLLINKYDIDTVIDILNNLKGRGYFESWDRFPDISVLSLIGKKMVGNIGVASEFLKIIYDFDINIRMVDTSKIRITIVVDNMLVEDKYQYVCDTLRKINFLKRG